MPVQDQAQDQSTRPARATVDLDDAPAPSPGEQLARAVAGAHDRFVTVTVQGALTPRFPLFAGRRRPTVRELVSVATADVEPALAVHEVRDSARPAVAGTEYESTPEAHFTVTAGRVSLTELSVTVPVPPEVVGDQVALAKFVDRRVLVRLGTAENELLLNGSADGVVPGLLRLPESAEVTGDADPMVAITEAAAEVEEMGGSCVAVVMHPAVYWQLVAGGHLAAFDAARVTLSRTRMIARDRVLLGDFPAAATLLDAPTGRLSLVDDGQPFVQAQMRVGLAVHLPAHLLRLRLPAISGKAGGAS